MVQSSDEHITARLGNKSWRLPVIWKCVWNSLSEYEYLQNVLVYGRIWYIWIVVIISEYWDWNWTTWMKTNEKILTCLQAIGIHSDVTPSYTMMWSERRGLWWICNEFKPLPAYTTMVVSLWFSFKDFSQVFPMRDYGVYIEWCTMVMIFVRVFSLWGFLVYISVCIQDGILSIGIPYWLEGSVWWYCWWVGCLTADCEGQTMYVRYMCVSSGAPCAQPHNIPTK